MFEKMTVEISQMQTLLMLRLLENEIGALHNHIASAVEEKRQGPHDARSLVEKLREVQAVAAVIRGAKNEAEGLYK